MANKTIFASAPAADVTVNNAGGLAYGLGAEAALAQYVMTGTFNATFYAHAQTDAVRWWNSPGRCRRTSWQGWRCTAARPAT